ncbi:MAG: T9SS type A sorting domain-containing protein, partial [Bacteroidia bacterium]|nr:T9SS type A sorting domain-containing protein [Bacteroidia bacterium]
DTVSTLLGFTRPALVDIDRNGTPELLVGNLTGFLRLYGPLWSQPTMSWPVIADLPYRWGKRASPSAWSYPDSTLLIVGNLKGGAHAFVFTSGATTLMPPPSNESRPYVLTWGSTGLHLWLSAPAEGSVFDVFGRPIYTFKGQGSQMLPHFSAGMYLLQLRIGNRVYIEKYLIP